MRSSHQSLWKTDVTSFFNSNSVRNTHRRFSLFAMAMLCIAVGCSDSSSPPAPAVNQESKPPAAETVIPSPIDDSAPLRTIEPEPTLARLPPPVQHVSPAAEPTRLPPAEPAPVETPEAAPRYLIIHADDAGMCHSANMGTIDVLQAGAVTSASIMVPCPGFEEFAEFARDHPEYDYGIHLTLNAEFKYRRWGPVLPVREVRSLVDSSGYLWRTGEQTAGNARTDDVERELRAQIDRALEFGVPISHLDSHMGTLFRRPDLLDIYLQLGVDYNLPVLLSRADDFFRQLEIDRDMIPQLQHAVSVLEQAGFPGVDAVRMRYRGDSVSSKRRAYLNMVHQAPAGITEILIHCARNDRDIRSVTSHYRIRTVDREVFTDPSVVDEIRRSGVQLTNWRKLHAMTSGMQQHHAN